MTEHLWFSLSAGTGHRGLVSRGLRAHGGGKVQLLSDFGCCYVGPVTATDKKWLVVYDPDALDTTIHAKDDPVEWVWNHPRFQEWQSTPVDFPEEGEIKTTYRREDLVLDCNVLYDFALTEGCGDPHGTRLIDTSQPYPSQIKSFPGAASEDYFNGVYFVRV
jgi:hypothetical protein